MVINVLMAAAEAVPFIKVGGLGDVIGALPQELVRQKADIRVILPKYSDIPEEFTAQMEWVGQFFVPVGWRRQNCDLYRLVYNDVVFYFVGNDYYFARQGIYGFYDDGERYAFFCRAVLEALPQLDFEPQVLHLHDWHTAMISVLLAAHYRHLLRYQAIRTVFTIHNLQYQGVFPKEILGDLLSLDWSYFQPEGVEFRGQVNFMKGGLVFADVLTTVSKTYAGEIQTPYFGEGLDGLLRKRSGVLSGIVNGIDYKLYNPSADPLIFTCYDARSLKKRQQNKIELQKLVGLPVNPDKPLLAMVSRLVASKGLELVARVLDEMLNLDIQVVVLGSGDEQYQNLFLQAAAQRPEQLAVHIGFDDRLAHRIFAGSDVFLMPSQYEPCGIGQLLAMRYGSLPVVRETGGLSDTVVSYNEQTGQGNGFSFTHYNAHDMLYTVERAVRLYQDKKIWNKIIRNAMKSNYSWTQSAAEYLSLYKALTEQDLLAKDQPSE